MRSREKIVLGGAGIIVSLGSFSGGLLVGQSSESSDAAAHCSQPQNGGACQEAFGQALESVVKTQAPMMPLEFAGFTGFVASGRLLEKGIRDRHHQKYKDMVDSNRGKDLDDLSKPFVKVTIRTMERSEVWDEQTATIDRPKPRGDFL